MIKIHPVFTDRVAHHQLEHVQGLILDGLPLGVIQAEYLLGGFRGQPQVGDGVQIGNLLGPGRVRVQPHRIDVCERAAQLFDLPARQGWIYRKVDRSHGLFRGFFGQFGLDGAGIGDGLGGLNVLRGDISHLQRKSSRPHGNRHDQSAICQAAACQ